MLATRSCHLTTNTTTSNPNIKTVQYQTSRQQKTISIYCICGAHDAGLKNKRTTVQQMGINGLGLQVRSSLAGFPNDKTQHAPGHNSSHLGRKACSLSDPSSTFVVEVNFHRADMQTASPSDKT